MINLRLSLTNPWWDRFETVKWWSGKTSFEHKFWECQIMRSDDIVAFDLRITARRDHAGIDLWLGLLGYAVNFNLYDDRHWNPESNQWEV